ncbi:hypothetical protein DXG01_001809 [Tephrocybe rancida]|nr:hypothetical protein DXG01_001809 [Tephrocybe rancida]
MTRVPPIPALIEQSATASINFLKIQSLNLTKALLFWAGKHGRKGAKTAADALKKDVKIVGSSGRFTVFAVHDSKIDTTGWKLSAEWSKAFGQGVAKSADECSSRRGGDTVPDGRRWQVLRGKGGDRREILDGGFGLYRGVLSAVRMHRSSLHMGSFIE